MPLGINATQNVTLADIEQLINVTNPADFFINVNHYVFEGWLFFILLLLTWIIFFFLFNLSTDTLSADQILNNLMYAGAIVSVISILLRGVYVWRLGVVLGLITDWQMWIFPIITIVVAVIVWMTKD